MVDIDNFKNYNDTLGHQSGDEILKNLAKILKDYSRKMDFVCRYGGEEFTIILPQTNKKEGNFIAERLREAIEKYHFPHEEIQPTQKLTVSLGLSTLPADGLTNSELIASCDKALYEAKKAGKNKVFSI
jgi:diguanylate cyclase (GGDEF)-like protein